MSTLLSTQSLVKYSRVQNILDSTLHLEQQPKGFTFCLLVAEVPADSAGSKERVNMRDAATHSHSCCHQQFSQIKNFLVCMPFVDLYTQCNGWKGLEPFCLKTATVYTLSFNGILHCMYTTVVDTAHKRASGFNMLLSSENHVPCLVDKYFISSTSLIFYERIQTSFEFFSEIPLLLEVICSVLFSCHSAHLCHSMNYFDHGK